ncbi:MAG: hypothetical protein IJS69_04525 [Selenomonadaceae bacterium]|nr:hypothetical protein [Selenomonadaceae bacterium]
MPETQPEKQFSPLVVPRTIEDLIYLQLQDFKDEFRYTRQEIYSRMYKLDDHIYYTRTAHDDKIDRLNEKINKLDEKFYRLESRIDRLADKLDRLADKLDNLSKKL